jgi:hypothetical protein
MTGQPGGHHTGAQGDAQVGMNLLARDQAGTLLDHPRDQRSAGRAADQQDRIQARRAFAGVIRGTTLVVPQMIENTSGFSP